MNDIKIKGASTHTKLYVLPWQVLPTNSRVSKATRAIGTRNDAMTEILDKSRKKAGGLFLGIKDMTKQ